MEQIVDIQLGRLVTRLKERNIGVQLTPAAKQLLIDEGYDPAYGARPLKRAIQRRLLDPIALKLLQGEFREAVDAKRDGFEFRGTSTSSEGAV